MPRGWQRRAVAIPAVIVLLAVDAAFCRFVTHDPVLPHVLGLAFTMCVVAVLSRGDGGRPRQPPTAG